MTIHQGSYKRDTTSVLGEKYGQKLFLGSFSNRPFSQLNTLSIILKLKKFANTSLHWGKNAGRVKNPIVPPLPVVTNFSTKYSILSKVYTDRVVYHGLSACAGDNPLSKACGLSPRTGGQTMV